MVVMERTSHPRRDGARLAITGLAPNVVRANRVDSFFAGERPQLSRDQTNRFRLVAQRNSQSVNEIVSEADLRPLVGVQADVETC